MWVASSQSASAAMTEVTLPQLTDQSSVIIGGKVLSKDSWWNSDKTLIFTTVKVRVDESLKGVVSPDDTISIMVPGGEIDGVGLGVEHAAQFEVGEEVILFLRPAEDSHYVVTAWEQGKLTIIDDRVEEKDDSVESVINQILDALKETPESEE
jgi:hypothetical protein